MVKIFLFFYCLNFSLFLTSCVLLYIIYCLIMNEINNVVSCQSQINSILFKFALKLQHFQRDRFVGRNQSRELIRYGIVIHS